MENSYIKRLIGRSKKAQAELQSLKEDQIEQILLTLAKIVFDGAEKWARMAVDETRMGVYEHKVLKKRGKSKILFHSVKGKKTRGIINRDETTGIIEIAKPVGVVGAITPCTNPIVTPLCNAMFAVKAYNSIIIAPHPRAKNCAKALVDEWNEALKLLNIPENLIQVIEEPSKELTLELMRKVDVIVATGGMGMVKAAYSSGKPSYGVGAGNVQCIIDRNVNIAEATSKIIEGRIFDNGIICSGEQSIIVHEDDYDAVINEFKNQKTFFINNNEDKEKIRKTLWTEEGAFSSKAVGQSVEIIGELAGIDIPGDTQVILVEGDGYGKNDILSKEKMCPVITAYKYKTFEEAIEIAQGNLNVEGAGHSAVIHSNNKENIEYAGLNLTVSRLLVNQISSKMVGGSFFNGLAPTTTLGCGTWGNNSISENFTFKHLMNITRIAYLMEDNKVPTDQELWG